jgi:hypothetical protein
MQTKPSLVQQPEHLLRLAFHRFLKRNPARYNQAKAWRRRLFGYHPVYLLLEHPKCGRTWLRYMVNQAESAAYGVPLQNTVENVWCGRHNLPRLGVQHGFKPGQPHKPFAYDLPNLPDYVRGVMLLVRRPERVMVSWYHQCRFRENLYSGDISSFLRDPGLGIRFYVRYVEHYLAKLKQCRRGLLLTYEEMRADPEGVLARVLEFIELELPRRQVAEIVRNSSFSRMQALQNSGELWVPWLASDPNDPRTWKVRSGGKEDLAEVLSPEDLDYLRSCYQDSPAFRELGYV